MNMICKNKLYVLLFAVVFAGAFLRFYKLGTNPPSLTWDEAAWGYNAYSLGLDGRDEFGRFLPITYLESFGDFKPPLYAYISILPVKILGLTEFSTRFASAFFGSLTVLLTFFLIKEIFFDEVKITAQHSKAEMIALLSSFVLAISPWHIMLSRAAFEANLASFFIVLGVYLFLAGVRKKNYFLIFSIISFVLSCYTFNTARIVSPVLFLILSVAKRKEILKLPRQFLSGALIGFVMILPLLLFLKTPQAKLRFYEVNIFSDISVINRVNQEIANDHNAWWSKIIHNRRFAYAVEYLKHYFDNLNPAFLFIKGDGNPKFSIQDVGEMYLWEAPFLVFGILFLFRKKEGNWWLIPLWLAIGIAPAAVARETPHALRIESSLPTFQILTAYGLYQVISNLKSQISNLFLKYLIFISFFLLIIFNFLYFYHNYFYSYPREFSGEWQYGYKNTISYVKSVQNKYDAIYFTNELGRPYIYFLFYLNYNPQLFRQEAKIQREVYGFVHINSFNKYYFFDNLSTIPDKGKSILYIDVPDKIPRDATIKNNFYLLNGNKVLSAYIK